MEVINKKLWREITKGLNLPSSITSAAFTLRTQLVCFFGLVCFSLGFWVSFVFVFLGYICFSIFELVPLVLICFLLFFFDFFVFKKVGERSFVFLFGSCFISGDWLFCCWLIIFL